jgi:hypothetical protein
MRDPEEVITPEDSDDIESSVADVIWAELEWQILMRRELDDVPRLIADELIAAFDIRPRQTASHDQTPVHAPNPTGARSQLQPGRRTVVRLVTLDQATDTALVELASTGLVGGTLTVETPLNGTVTVHLDPEGAVNAISIAPASSAVAASLHEALTTG